MNLKMADAKDKQSEIQGINSSLCPDEQRDILYQIGSRVDKILGNIDSSDKSGDKYTLGFSLQWELPEFMASEFDEEQRIADVLTLSGSAVNAQAETCGRYVQEHWPRLGLTLIESLQSGGTTTINDSWAIFPLASEGKEFTVTANADTLRDVTQQLCWLAATFRYPRTGVLSESFFTLKGYEWMRDTPSLPSCDAWLQISVLPLQPLLQDNQSLWYPLFPNFSLAKRFPISPRGDERGLEIPLAVMARLGGVHYATEQDGGIILKGFSTGFVPMDISDKSIQWHFYAGKLDVRVQALEVIESCPHWTKTENEKDLEKRCFLVSSKELHV
jgi:hypothetical protein